MKVIKVREKNEDEKRYEVFEVGYYEVFVTTYGNGRTRTSVSKDMDVPYLPDIYFKDFDLHEGPLQFVIQTTSYGALEMEEINKMIGMYQYAIEAAEAMTETFLG